VAFIAFALAAILIGAGVAGARWLVTRAFGIRTSFREMVNTTFDRGRPVLAYARALASIAAIYLACVIVFIPGYTGDTTVIDETSMRVTVRKSGPAAQAGIADGDRIVSVDGEAVTDWDQLKKLVAAHPNETIKVEVDRGGERKTFSVTTDGPKMYVGPYAEKKPVSAGWTLTVAFEAPYKVVSGIVRGVARSFGEKPELTGPVGISREMSAAKEEGMGTFFRLLGALASYQGFVVSLVLLSLAFMMSFAAKRTLPTSGNSS
jgi:regulator of sigma E protease